MRSRLPVENLIVKLFMKHTWLVLSNGKTHVTVWYKLLRYNLLEATPTVAPMETLSYTLLSTLLQNGYITNWPCLTIGKRKTYYSCQVRPASLLSMSCSQIHLISSPKKHYLLSSYINWTVLLINLNKKISTCLIQTRMGRTIWNLTIYLNRTWMTMTIF